MLVIVGLSQTSVVYFYPHADTLGSALVCRVPQAPYLELPAKCKALWWCSTQPLSLAREILITRKLSK